MVKWGCNVVLGAGILVSAVANAQDVIALETFDTDEAGWATQQRSAVCALNITGDLNGAWGLLQGLPGGAYGYNETSAPGIRPVLAGGASFSGDLSEAIGGWLVYDRGSNVAPSIGGIRDDVMLEAIVDGKTVALFADTVGRARRIWTASWIPLTPGSWRVGVCDGPFVDPQQFAEAMANVTRLAIRAEYRSGAEIQIVDNVRILGPSDAPSSTFDEDLEGWTVRADATLSWFDDPGGSPQCARAIDAAQGAGYEFVAPESFRGDQTRAIGKTFDLDLAVSRGSNFGDRGASNFLVLVGSDELLTYRNDKLDIATGFWLHQSVPIVPSPAWRYRSGDVTRTATLDDFQRILGGLAALRIRGEYVNGGETGWIDNVVFGTCSPSVMAAAVGNEERFFDPAPLCPSDGASIAAFPAGDGPFEFTWRVQSPAGDGPFVEIDEGAFLEEDTGFGFTASVGPDGTLELSDVMRGSRLGIVEFEVVVEGRCGAALSNQVEFDFGGCCVSDWDGNGVVNAADVGSFLSAYFLDLVNGTLVADFDGNGIVNAADVGAFLSAYFQDLTNPDCAGG